MDLLQAIKNRHSVRQYIDKPIDVASRQELTSLVGEINEKYNQNIQLILDEPKAFTSRLARYGKFVNVKNYFAIVVPKGEKSDEKAGYCGEMLVLRAQQLGLNTCWVGLTYKKDSDIIKINDNEKLVCVIALGYGANEGSTHKIKTYDKVAKSKGIAPQWFVDGVEAALLAPTAVNQQKFKIELLDDDKVKMSAGFGFYTKVDLGIVRYHFEIGARGAKYTEIDKEK